MNRTLSEQNVLNKLGISDFRHMMNITVRQSEPPVQCGEPRNNHKIWQHFLQRRKEYIFISC